MSQKFLNAVNKHLLEIESLGLDWCKVKTFPKKRCFSTKSKFLLNKANWYQHSRAEKNVLNQGYIFHSVQKVSFPLINQIKSSQKVGFTCVNIG